MNILLAIWSVLSSVLSKFGPWFKQIVKDGETTYESLETEAQHALQQGSGILAVFNADLNATPADVKAKFKAAFPALSLDVLHGFIDTVQNKIGIIEGDIPVTLDDAIVSFQTLLKKYESDSTFLGRISKLLAGEFAILFSPETPVQKIDDSLEYVYHLIVKPHVANVIASLPVSSTPPPAPPVQEEPNPPQGNLSIVADPAPAPPQQGAPFDEPLPPPPPATVPLEEQAANLEVGEIPVIAADPDMQISNEAAANLGNPPGEDTASTSESAPPADTNTDEQANVESTPAPETPQQDLSFEEAIAKEKAAQGLPPSNTTPEIEQ